MSKQIFTIPDDIRKRKVETLDIDAQHIATLKEYGCKTIADVVPIQHDLPDDCIYAVKKALMFPGFP